MGRDSGLGLALLVGILLSSLKPRKALNGGAPPYLGPLPTTPEEAEEVTQEVIRIRKITVHPTVIAIPTIPTTVQIETARARIQQIDENIPTWVKKRWGREAVQTPGWMPRGEV